MLQFCDIELAQVSVIMLDRWFSCIKENDNTNKFLHRLRLLLLFGRCGYFIQKGAPVQEWALALGLKIAQRPNLGFAVTSSLARQLKPIERIVSPQQFRDP